MRFSEADGRKVVSTSTADTVGKVDGFVVDVSGPSVVALQLKKTPGDGEVLAWSDLTAFGADAVTVESADRITEGEQFAELTGKANTLLGKRVLTTAGDELGEVSDVDFDPADGRVTALLLGKHASGPEVAGKRMLGIGSYAVVVQAE